MTGQKQQTTLKRIQQLALMAVNTDGADHKQHYLNEILELTGMPVAEVKEAGNLPWPEGRAA